MLLSQKRPMGERLLQKGGEGRFERGEGEKETTGKLTLPSLQSQKACVKKGENDRLLRPYG